MKAEVLLVGALVVGAALLVLLSNQGVFIVEEEEGVPLSPGFSGTFRLEGQA